MTLLPLPLLLPFPTILNAYRRADPHLCPQLGDLMDKSPTPHTHAHARPRALTPGEVTMSRAVSESLDVETVAHLLKRHMLGDSGAALTSVRQANAQALETGVGCVTSFYDLPPVDGSCRILRIETRLGPESYTSIEWHESSK